MASYLYTAVPQEDDPERGKKSTPLFKRSHGDYSLGQRMPYCIGFCVLLAIVYVLSKTNEPVNCDESISMKTSIEEFDIGAYRAERLAATPPHIIECKEAGEGGSQEACHLPRDLRYKALNQKGMTLWMTGLSGSGKSTIAKALEEELVTAMGKHVQLLDGDNVRTGLNRDLGFSEADRAESVRRVGEMALLFNAGGVITIVSLVSPYRADRDDVRRRHEEEGLLFAEVFMNVPLEVVQERDPKGLYKKVANGEITGFTGVDAPYEAPINPEINLPNYRMTIQQCVHLLISELRKFGALEGGPTHPLGLPLPDGFTGTFLEDELLVPANLMRSKLKEAESLPKVLLTDIDYNWLQTIGEGWAAPLRGFMREGALLQTIHFNSILIDPFNLSAAIQINELPTDWNDYHTRAKNRVSMSVPIVLPISGYTKAEVESSNQKAAALVTKDGRIVAIIRAPEIYENRKEEIVTRCFGAIDRGHPYISHIYSGGDFLLGGEIELLQRIRYNDGLDQYRLTPKELYLEFERKGADVVYAFQTRNPTHAGHAYLMRTGRELLKNEGYSNPILWLSPLGGWTKDDDVPLDVRVKQHVAVLEEKMLDPTTTVMSIWPAPMIYAGPTEVQFHAKSRRNAGASYFVVGRDPAGMKGSLLAETHVDDDLYKGEHGRFVLLMSPVLEDSHMKLLSFDKFYYDIKDNQMKGMDANRPDDFISISGTKMRTLAAQGAVPCGDPIPADLVAANCVPKGFMVPSGWKIVCDYYQNSESSDWVKWSQSRVSPFVAFNTISNGQFGTTQFELYVTMNGRKVSPWHEITMRPIGGVTMKQEFQMVVEIPMWSTAKMEMQKSANFNPIKQDISNGLPRYYSYGTPLFNYGFIPQTWEDPSVLSKEGNAGDNDPIDVLEIGSSVLPMGTVTSVKVLGSLELIDQGETDHKIIVIRADDVDSYRIHDMNSLEYVKPGITQKLIDWLVNYKTSDGKPQNVLSQYTPTSVDEAIQIINECHERWQLLHSGVVSNSDFWLS